MKTLLLKNGMVVSAHGIKQADVLVRDGKIEAIAENIAAHDAEVVDCTGLHILPGAIDMHVHFRDPGGTHKEDFLSGSKAAAAGGVTTVVDMPNTTPLVTTVEALEAKRKIIEGRSYVNYGFYFGATEDNIEEARTALAGHNIKGIKIYMGKSTGNLLVESTEMLERFLNLGAFLIVHAEDQQMIGDYEEKLSGAVEPRTHSLIRNPYTAESATKRIIHLAKKNNARVHITHCSTALEVAELRKCKTHLITADTTPHHLFLTDEDYDRLGNRGKVNPPLRFDEDHAAMWEAIKDGTIDAVATDHAPHVLEEKDRGYKDAPAGMPGVETMLPLLLDAVNRGELTLSKVIQLTAEHPAHLLSLQKKGHVAFGYDADLTIVDMNEVRKVGEPHYYTKCNWSPFDGRELRGWPVMTIVGGEVVFNRGKIENGTTGKEI